MATWDDLVMAAQPRLINYPFDTTENADWKFKVGPFGAPGSPADLSGATFECKVLTEVAGDEVVAWSVTGDSSGYLTGTLDDGSTASLAGSVNPRKCVWYCHGTLSGAKLYFWGPTGSPFLIEQGA